MITYAEYTSRDEEILKKMVFSLYMEDPEGEAMDREKIDMTIKYAEDHPECIDIIMLKDGSEAAGYAIVTFSWSNEWGGNILCIDELFVREQWRRQGIGASFVESISARYPEIKGISLEVTPSNERAYRMYEKLGFSADACRHMFKKRKRLI